VAEFDLISRIRLRQLQRGRRPAAGEAWIGDDSAVATIAEGPLLITTDAVVEGVHFDLELVGLDDVGWKAMAASLSDIAAMGGRPTHSLVTVIGPPGNFDIDSLYDGLEDAAETYDSPIIGGDLSVGPVLVVSVTVVGSGAGVPGASWFTGGSRGGAEAPVLRSGASAGDILFVTGALGSSAAGLEMLRSGRSAEEPDLASAHRRPRPLLAEGATARFAGASAMTDVSDGLAVDLRHLAESSRVGIVVDQVPVAPGVSRSAKDPEAAALGGGEDYELIFSAPDPERIESAFVAAGLRRPIRIGRCTDDPEERRLAGGAMPHLGWEHEW